jgi:hypothetical protein
MREILNEVRKRRRRSLNREETEESTVSTIKS